ncbi:DUF3300 domain-containing protein [Pseudomonas sp. JS3066]|uniref:DUF3300 domain-containing protein n=1 Tax=unclassified Pseudomonas TaxID=196821 RepID=UPI000EA871AE|nr:MULTISPECIES: DUF3300 domain-containing protein [unclassified Pseudomonas]AYF87771.1 DUF3300 domain-containing protein [Pseudomonas sp. DY-1]MDH4655551.1 DUF3300 domain-containing protein [Pseudomonas sp. BN606]MRK19947.1 DUF3300 domain-containing protein [Pseudomonas sp. JG-B]WVK94664.1 DUF3300 domain-containing protein [Pseudomonas sp. JS3066]
MPNRTRFSAVLLALLAFPPAFAATDAGISAAEDGDGPSAGVSAAPESTPEAAPAQAAAPAAQPAAPQAVFKTEELDQMMAPIALYPDSLLAQVLMAATYPGNVADAVAWSKAHPDAKGDDAVKQVANQPWDPSVQSLVAFPQVLATLGQDPAWVQRVGDAFLAQPNDVMDSVQRLRRQAQAAGNLESNEQQKVTVQEAPAPSTSTTTVVQPASSNQTIVIEPSNPQVVYVPSYNPTVVYGTWSYPSYPPPYYPPPPSYGYPIATGLATGLAFGVGVGIVNSLWGDCDWGGGDVDIDVNRYNNINSNRQINRNQNKFVHNPINRQGVPYRDNINRQQNGLRLNGSQQREALRGYDANRTAERQKARQSLQQRGIEAPARTNQQARERAQAATRDIRNDPQARQRAEGAVQQRQRADANRQQQRPRAQNNQQVRQQARQQHASARQGPRNNAFAGARQPSQTRAAANRGQVSRASASRPHQSAAGRQVQRPAHAPSRGGGGRRR